MVQVRSLPRRPRKLLIDRVSLGLVLLLSGACSGANANFVRPPPAVTDNTFGAGDVFAVRVFGEADISQEYRVSPDGTIDFPYIGRVRVQGLDPTQVADTLRTQLLERQILTRPQVSVFVRELNSRRINVLGAVAHPGSFAFEPNMTIVQAITAAGGFSPLANQSSVRLTRRIQAGGQRSYEIPVDLITDGRVSNVSLAPGDLVNVPSRTF